MRTDNLEQENDTWGAIGIGAMIVFISLILVAAVASAVIIQTAEKLQQNAQTAGDDTSDELSGKLTIMQGFVDNNNDYVLYVRLVLVVIVFNTALSLGNCSVLLDMKIVKLLLQMHLQHKYNYNQSAFGGGVTMTPQNAYKILIAANICDAASSSWITIQAAQLFIHVESGGTTFETLDVATHDTGQAVI